MIQFQPDSPCIDLMGLRLDAVDELGCIDVVMRALHRHEGGWIITANLDHLRRFATDSIYQNLCAEATMVVADGRPMLWAARVQKTPLPGLVAGSNLIWELSEAASLQGRSIFLLGGEEGTASAAADRLIAHCPRLEVAGTFFPEYGFERDAAQLDELIVALVRAQPDIVYVALGSPKQEVLIRGIRDCLPRAWWIGVGISFNFVSGKTRRAPAWMQRCGLEWAHRLSKEPRRLFKRYVMQCLPFALTLFSSALRRRFVHVEPIHPTVMRQEERRTAA